MEAVARFVQMIVIASKGGQRHQAIGAAFFQFDKKPEAGDAANAAGELRADFVGKKGGRIDWHSLNDYILSRANDGTGEGQLLAQRADKAVRESLGRRNLEVEENLLRQSNVLTDAPTTQSKNPALDRIR